MEDRKGCHFEEKSFTELYKTFRPRHPATLFSLINSKLERSSLELNPCLQREYGRNSDGRWARALDVGCGTGLSTLPLTQFVQEVVAIDKSRSQIDQAILEYGDREASRMTFLQADVSEALSMFAPSSFDLVSFGFSAHWMTRGQLCSTAFKLLRPGGIMVEYVSGTQKFEDPAIDKLNMEITEGTIYSMTGEQRVKAYTGEGQIMNELMQYFSNAEREDSIFEDGEMSADEIKGYVSTFSGYQNYLKEKKSGGTDVLDEFIEKMKVAKESGGKFKYRTPYYVFFARKAES